MDKYGTTEEQMAHVAVKNHRHGTLNPTAQSPGLAGPGMECHSY